MSRRTGWIANLPKFRRGCLSIFVTVVLLTAILGDQPIAQALVLEPGRVIALEAWWQPLTALLIFPQSSTSMVLGTLVIQWFLAGDLENFWGTRRYLILVLGCGIGGYLASVGLALISPTIAQTVVGGSTPIDLAALTAFGVVFGKRRLRLLGGVEVGARGFMAFAVGLLILAPLARGVPWPAVIPWLTAVAGALLVTTQPWRRWGDSGKVRGKKRQRKHLRVVEPDPSPRLLN